jgi:anthranilate phosphoribosyltransferase
VVRCVDEVGIGFCFAPSYHPAIRHVMPTRRELAVRTVFNTLGPLCNPAGAQHQTIGVSDYALAERMAGVLAEVGTGHSLVFHGADGLDELTVTGPSHLWEVRGGDVASYQVDPADLGIAYADPADLVGGEVEVNRAMADAVLEGKPGAPRDAVVLAAGAALFAWRAFQRERQLVTSPGAWRALEHKLYFDALYDALFYRPAAALARALRRNVEEPVIERSLDEIGTGTIGAGGGLARVQTGLLRTYALTIAFAVCILVVVFVAVR